MRTLPILLILTAGCYRLGEADYQAVADRDDDGDIALAYGGGDCDDDDPSINSDADEYCDGIDNNCDGATDEYTAVDAPTWYQDGDGDGYGDPATTLNACELPTGYAAEGTDCDDSDDGLHPETWWYADSDSDDYGDPDTSLQQCEQPDDHVLDANDCDDTTSEVNPGEDEVCDDVDHDCNGDDGRVDSDGDSWAVCEGDCDDDDATQYPHADEYCNGEDDDCDKEVDEDEALDVVTWYADADNDGYGDAAVSDIGCDQPTGFVADASDCDDEDAAQYPGADETCNAEDDDCDGTTDEDDALDAVTWYADSDNDSYGDAAVTDVECYQPSGYVADDTDCDDSDGAQHPGADEYCSGEDDDCDGTVDENDALDVLTWYLDADADGYGVTGYATEACDQPTGYAAADEDCDDFDAAQHPGADEYCNEEDDDCDGFTDENDAVDMPFWYYDEDGDGYGDSESMVESCDQPTDYVDVGGDCDDEQTAANPGETEICDEIDNDCDGQIDSDKFVPTDFPTIQAAVTASMAGESVCVHPGTYYETVELTRDISLGSFDMENTVIDAGALSPALTLTNVPSTSAIRGFTITGAEGADGIAITSTSSDTLLEDILVTGNYTTSTGSCSGALVYIDGGAPQFDGLEISENMADCNDVWGVIFARNSAAPTFDHFTYLSNYIYGSGEVYGGLVAYSGTSVTVTNAIFAGNGVEPDIDAVTVRSSVLSCIGCGVLDVENATFHANAVDAGTGTVYSGVLWDDNNVSDLNNVIFSSNSASGSSVLATVAYGSIAINNSDIYDQSTPRFASMADPTGIGTVYIYDPAYTNGAPGDPMAWDFTLQSSSLLIDLGDPSIYDADGSTSDIGAYGGPDGDGW